jgi:hypothetical protein
MHVQEKLGFLFKDENKKHISWVLRSKMKMNIMSSRKAKSCKHKDENNECIFRSIFTTSKMKTIKI